jgi:hypothetical protein
VTASEVKIGEDEHALHDTDCSHPLGARKALPAMDVGQYNRRPP